MNKLAIIVPFYKRHALTSLCFDRLRDQSKRLCFDVFVCGSEGEKSQALAKGLNYIEKPNILGTKLNALLNECKDYDGVIVLGSDDFISDSIIELYKTVDTSKKVYYSFNDIYIYSDRLKTLSSDLDYTREGKTIGAGRMFTKPTLEAVNYSIWDNKRQRGMDGNCERTMFKNEISEEILSLDGHFMIDVKIQENLTSQNVVKTGHKTHELKLITDQLGALGKKILSLKPEGSEKISINQNQNKMEKFPGKVVKTFHQFKEGETHEFKENHFKKLVKAGYLEPIEKKTAVKTEKKPAEKKTTTRKTTAKK